MCLGVPGQVVAIVDAVAQLAQVDIGGVRRAVNVALILDDGQAPETCVGDWVLVHVGFAMARIDESEAAAMLALLGELEEPDELSAGDTPAASPEGRR